MVGKKRLLLAAATLASVGAVVALATGVTFGLFSAQAPSQSNTFTAGTVSLDQGKTIVCTTSNNMSPGDTGTCTLNLNYEGSVPAYLAADVKVSGTPGNGTNAYQADSADGATVLPAPGLFDGSANGLQLNISDTQGSLVSGTTILGQGAPGAAVNLTGACTGNGSEVGCSSGGNQHDLLLDTNPFTSGPTGGDTITVSYTLPLAANNAYQAAGTTITLTVHAVQANNNPLPATCNTVGQQCASGFGWS